jgi:hypothetical protein
MRCFLVPPAALLAIVAGALPARAQIVDHTSIARFEQIPERYLTAAAGTSMMFVDLSVGANIWRGLSACLAKPSDAVAPGFCRRWQHDLPQFNSPQGEVRWNHPGGYPTANWLFYAWPGKGVTPSLDCGVGAGMWFQMLECFIRWVDAHPDAYRVMSFQLSYMEVAEPTDIMSPTRGFFAGQANRADVSDLESLRTRHPNVAFFLETTSLARAIGTATSRDFNAALRQYAASHKWPLLDVADIESHDPSDQPCFDNRDGVPYIRPTGKSENYPDDGQALPAICQHYTSETDGGHLGSPSAGMLRLAKGVWVLMAQIAGWREPSDHRNP